MLSTGVISFSGGDTGLSSKNRFSKESHFFRGFVKNVLLHKYRRRLLMACPRTGALHFFSPHHPNPSPKPNPNPNPYPYPKEDMKLLSVTEQFFSFANKYRVSMLKNRPRGRIYHLESSYKLSPVSTLMLLLQLLQIWTVFFLAKYFVLHTIWHHEWSVTILFF
jgi:hypothetical protein